MAELISDLAADAIADLRRHGGRRHLIGVAGPPGAGKSTLVEALVRACGSDLGRGCAIGLPMDGFHLTNQELLKRGLRDRKGAPETFDAQGFVSALERLAESDGVPMNWPGYSRHLHEPVIDAIPIPAAAKLIFVEGNYLLLHDQPWNEIREILDSIWYVAADMATIRARLQQRQLDAGRPATEADAHVDQSDMENAARVEETKELADRIVRISAADPLLAGLKDPATGRPIVPD